MRSESEVVEALRTIVEVCEESDCDTCYLRTYNGNCGLMYDSQCDRLENPQDWEIKSEDHPRILLH